jgi:hypothetical protein
MTTKSDHEIEREAAQKARAKAMKDLTPEQLAAIKKTHDQLRSALNMICECNDLYLSDIRELENCFWALHNNFNLCHRD